MMPDGLKELLILQDRDIRRVQVEKNLAAVPRERTASENRIAALRTGIDDAKKAVVSVELRRKDLETALGGFEDQLRRYKSQQLMVKKNDEFQALSHEIELAQGRIGETEEKEIEILYELDREKERAREIELRKNEEIATERAQLARLEEREKNLLGAVAEARTEVESVRGAVSQKLLTRYDRLAKTVGLPAVVPLRDQKCGGCHLKVSAGVDSEARKGTEIIACDNCSRIVFLETS